LLPDVMSANAKGSEKPFVCVVDDDSLIRDSTIRLIRSFGFRVEAFASAEEFENSDYLDEPACLILDVRMPGRNGLELQHRLSEAGHRIPIIFITAHADDEQKRRAMEAGQSDSFTNRSARNRCFKLSVLLWENHNRKTNVKNKTRSGDSVANVSLRIGHPSLRPSAHRILGAPRHAPETPQEGRVRKLTRASEARVKPPVSATATKVCSRSSSLKSWSAIEESYCENLDLLLGDLFSDN
jgi:DNA-binding response OmpR family regulator